MNLLHSRFPAIALLCVLAFSPATSAAEPSWAGLDVGSHVAVKTSSGRTIRGAVDQRTDEHFLWLAAEVEGMSIASRLSREAVVEIKSSSAFSLPKLEARPTRLSLSSPAAQSKFQPANPAGAVGQVGQAKSLAISDQLENWDSDPQYDGLGLYLIPRDAQGNLVAAAGTLSASLTVFPGDARSTRGTVQVAENWSTIVSENDYTQHGGYVQLPFRQMNIDNDHHLQPVAELQVRLNIAGQGVLDATLPDVVLRPYSATNELRSIRSRARP